MKIRFENLLNVDPSLQMKIREWRNDDDIREKMFNDHLISEDEHRNWLNFLSETKKQGFFVAFDEKNEPLGVLNYTDYSAKEKTTDWGIYLAPQAISRGGIGTLLEYHFLNYLFDELGVEKVNAEVLEFNAPMLKLQEKMGFVIEGRRRKNLIRRGTRIDVILLGMLKEEWTRKRFEIAEKLEKK